MADQPTPNPTVSAAPQGAIVSLANLPANMTKAQLITPGSGKKFDPIWRLVPGQPVDAANRAASSQFYVTRKVRNPNNAKEKIAQFSKGFGSVIKVIPIAYGLSRDYTIYHNDTQVYEQLCHSDGFFTPDVRFAGDVIKGSNVIAHKCAEIRRKVSKKTGVPILDDYGQEQFEVVALCPFAQFTPPATEGGKIGKAKCDVIYTVYFAVKAKFADPTDATKEVEKWVAAEIGMKVMQASMGANIVGMFGQLEKLNVPISTHPMQLTLTEYKFQNSLKSSYDARLIMAEEVDRSTISPVEFEEVSTVIADTIAARKKWAQYDPSENDDVTTAAPANAQTSQPATTAQGQEIVTTATKPAAPASVTPPPAQPKTEAEEKEEALIF